MMTPPLTNASTTSEESAEEFPLQISYETGSAILTKAEFTPQPSIKSVRPKRFSLQSITRPFVRSAKANTKNITSRSKAPPKALKSAQKSGEGSHKLQRRHRVSFSPSTEAEGEAKQKTSFTTKPRLRRSSFSDSISKSHQQPVRKRALSISWDHRGVHLAIPKAVQVHRALSLDKGRPAGPQTTKQQVVAAKQAARNARALEQIINAGASLNIDSTADLKAKRERKTGGKLDKSKVQMVPAVSPRKVKALGTALLDSVSANEIISELRSLQLQQRDASPTESSDAKEINQTKPPHPIKAICLDCCEEDIDARQVQHALTLHASKENFVVEKEKAAPTPGVTNLWGWTDWLKPQEKLLIIEKAGKAVEIAPPAGTGLLSGVNPISFLLSPATTATAVGAIQNSTFDVIGSLSGAAIRAANGGDKEMQEVHPPLDRLAILVHWWGFELTIPRPSMAYLGRAQNISSSLMSILQTIAISGGVPEILPFVRYFSAFVDLEFSAIKSQDQGHGVVVAATWLMPMALVPRPWDYPTGSGQTTRPSLPPSAISLLTLSSLQTSETRRPLSRRESALASAARNGL